MHGRKDRRASKNGNLIKCFHVKWWIPVSVIQLSLLLLLAYPLVYEDDDDDNDDDDDDDDDVMMTMIALVFPHAYILLKNTVTE